MFTIFSPKSLKGDIDVGHFSNIQYRPDCYFGDIDIQKQELEKPEDCGGAVYSYFNFVRVIFNLRLRLI